MQAIESWMMADYELLLTEIGTTKRPIDLGIPGHASQVELIARPKMKLKAAVHMAYASRPRRRRESDIDFLYEPLGQFINMGRLKQVPSYRQFVCDLKEVLVALEFITNIHIM